MNRKKRKTGNKSKKKNTLKKTNNIPYSYSEPVQVPEDTTIINFPIARISPALRTLFLRYKQLLSKEQALAFEEFLSKKNNENIEKEEVYSFLRNNQGIRKKIWGSI